MQQRSSRFRSRSLVGALALVALLAGCAASSPEPASSPSASPARTPTPLPTKDVGSIEERCSLDVPGRIGSIASADGRTTLGAVVEGSGTVAVVLLHQAQASGVCGWVTYARWLASQGVLAVAVDDCTHGPSRCAPEVQGDTRATVAIAVDEARRRGATTVGVVGASMGGSRALGVGQAAGADAVVDLSGPAQWDGVPDALAAARATTVPLLVVWSPGDRDVDRDALESAVAASPATDKEIVAVPGNAHGWDLTMDSIAADAKVTPTGRRVLDWVRAAAR